MQVVQLPHRELATARQLHAVWTLAYAQEAALLGVLDFAPLQRTVQDIQASAARFLGVWGRHVDKVVVGPPRGPSRPWRRPGEGLGRRDLELLGALSLEPDDESDQTQISALVVHPAHQRQGIARALVQEALRAGGSFSVATGADNVPALALYQGLGFVPYRRGTIGPQELPLLKLRWQGGAASEGRPCQA